MVVVSAKIPARLSYLLMQEAKEKDCHFAVICGEKIMDGVEASRIKKEIKNDK